MKLSIKLKKHYLFISIAITAIGLLMVPAYYLSLKINKYLPPKTQSFLTKTHHQVKISTANIIDIFQLKTYFHPALTKDLKSIKLIMSVNDISNLSADINKAAKIGYLDKNSANNQQIALEYQQTQIPAEISYHSGGTKEIVPSKPDYNLKLSDGQTIDTYANFNLFNSATHDWITPIIANLVAKRLDLTYVHQEPVKLTINNQSQGVYTFEEKINQDFLDRHNLTNATIIKLKDETRLVHRNNPVALNAHHLSGFDYEIANTDSVNNPAVLYTLDQFYKAIKSKNIDQVLPFINLDYFARYDAYRELLGIDHDTAGDNLNLIYNPFDQKFYPLVRSEGDLNPLVLQGGTTLKSFNQYNPHLEDQYDYPRLFLLLHQNPQYRQLKYQYLNLLVENYPQLRNDFQNIISELGDAYLYDTTDEVSVIKKKKLFKYYLDTINSNQQLIKSQLEFSQIAVNILNHSSNTVIEIIPDAIVPIEFTQFLLNFENGNPINITEKLSHDIIMAGFSEDYDLLPTTFSYTIETPKPVTSTQIKAKNKITNQEINSIYTAIATP